MLNETSWNVEPFQAVISSVEFSLLFFYDAVPHVAQDFTWMESIELRIDSEEGKDTPR